MAEALRAREGWIVAQTSDAQWMHGLETVAQTRAGLVHAQRVVVLVRDTAERVRSLAALLLSWAAQPEMAAVLQQFLGRPVDPWPPLSQEGVLRELIDRCDALRAAPATAPLLRANSAYADAACEIADVRYEIARGQQPVTVAHVHCSDNLGVHLEGTLGIAGLAVGAPRGFAERLAAALGIEGLAVGRLHSSRSAVRAPLDRWG